MLQVQHLRKDYGAVTLFSHISFIINNGEHVGLIGANGAGKSTLLRCILGQEQPDDGYVHLSPTNMTIGYLPQDFSDQFAPTVGDVVAEAQAEFRAAEADLYQTADALSHSANLDMAMQAYDQAFTRFEALGGYAREQRAAAVLQGLGLGAVDPQQPVTTLSGGQKTRLGMAVLLLHEPDLLLLDEPTNHLDRAALEWLEKFIQTYPHAALIVSHDRAFLDCTVTRILFLDAETRTVTSYSGNYSDFAAARRHEHERHMEAWKRQQETVERMETDIAHLKGRAMRGEQSHTTADRDSKFALDQRSSAKKVARMARARERKLDRLLASEERVERPRRQWALRLNFGSPPPGGQAVLRLDDVTFAYADRPLLFDAVSLEVQYGDRIALIGPNGAGKTSLLRLMLGQLQPTNGHVTLGSNVKPGMLTQEQENLDPAQSVLGTILAAHAISESEARTFLHRFLFAGDTVFQRVGDCSPGERSRLQLALLMLQGCNLLLLDEPLNHLDIDGREQFSAAIDAFEGTVIAVSHDRAFVDTFADRVIEVRDGCVRA